FLPHRSVFKVRLSLLATLKIIQVIDTVVNHFFISFRCHQRQRLLLYRTPFINARVFYKVFLKKFLSERVLLF
ncbi:hypothetical protein, partial [Exiguobacterium aestuarii]|uniref:hypothetical protein n=1 Tax=Exiguobacterium aestuarii TaxID=273527 RepID=UPI0021AF37C9